MPRSTRRGRGGFIFLPQRNYTLSWKAVINEGATDEVDITDYIITFSVSWEVYRLATGRITLSNINGKWLDTWNGGETVTIYAEYGDVTPTNKIFHGKLFNIMFGLSSNGYECSLECVQAPELAGIKIIEQFDNALITDAIKTIVDTYYSGIVTYTGLQSTTARFTGNFKHVSGINALGDLASSADLDLYISTGNDIQLFARNSIENNVESVSYQSNLKSLSDYGTDNKKRYNRVTVYGKEDRNILLLKTKQDTDDQADLWRRDMVITDNGLTTMDEISEKTEVELSNGISLDAQGRISALGMPKLVPGDSINVLAPYCGATGRHRVVSINHSLTMSGFITSANVISKPKTLMDFFEERIDAEERLKPYNNLNAMTDSYTTYFNEIDAPYTLVNCEIDEERAKLTSGETSGSIVFDSITADNSITQCELRIVTNFPNHELCTYQASNNGGLTYETITPGTLHTFTSSGSTLKFKINLVGDDTHDPVFESVCLLYKVV